MSHNHSPIAYTYDADHHCPECAGRRFGEVRLHLHTFNGEEREHEHPTALTFEDGGYTVVDHEHPRNAPLMWGDPTTVPEDATDSEGNPVGAVFAWDEWWEPYERECQTLSCGTCRAIIATVHVDLFGQGAFEGDAYDSCEWDTDNPVVVRDTGGSIPRTLREWVDTMLSDAESVGADVSKVRAWLDVYDYDVAHADASDPDEPLEDYARELDEDIEEAILATGQYVAVADGDSQSWVIYKRKVGVEA